MVIFVCGCIPHDSADQAQREAARACCRLCGCPNGGPSLGGRLEPVLGEDMTPGNGGGIFRVSSRRFIPNPIVPTTSVFLPGVLKLADSDAI
jgi:hypothetical protein